MQTYLSPSLTATARTGQSKLIVCTNFPVFTSQILLVESVAAEMRYFVSPEDVSRNR